MTKLSSPLGNAKRPNPTPPGTIRTRRAQRVDALRHGCANVARMNRPEVARTVCVLGAAASAAAPLLPFLRAGDRVRSGYELVQTARSAGFIDGADGRAALLALAALPVIAAGALLAAVLRATMVTATCAVAAGVIAAAAGTVAWRSPVEMEAGAWIAMTIGVVSATMALATSLRSR